MAATLTSASRLRPGAGLLGIQAWFRTACRQVRDLGTTYDLDPHLVADTGLTEVKLPFLPRRTPATWRTSTWMG